MQYRIEIDGLRAIAILPVIWVHSGLPYLNGGFLGVDVFFVISGFLITTILLKDMNSDRFSLMTFYERRARRILPALFFVIAITGLFAPSIDNNPKFLEELGESIIGTILFISNIYFWQTSGYFGTASELSPMLHTWSLAVEEQYYIFYPLILLVFYYRGRKALVSILIFISIVSLIIAEWGAVNSPIGNFYLLPSRAWELLFGGLVAIFYSPERLKLMNQKVVSILALTGIVLIFSSYFLFSSATAHPTFLTLIPVLGTCLVLLFANQENIVGKILSVKVITFIGLISYSLYLWHQPILALMKRHFSLHLEFSQIIVALLLMGTLSWFTYKFIESPFRSKNKFSRRAIFNYSLLGMFVGCLLGLIMKGNILIQEKFYPAEMVRYKIMLEAENSHLNQAMYDKGCKFWSDNFTPEFENKFINCAKNNTKAIFIIGGSHGMDLYNAISMNSEHDFVVSVSKGFCRAHEFTGKSSNKQKCQYEDFKNFSKIYGSNISHVFYTQTPDRLFNENNTGIGDIKNISTKKIDQVIKYLTELKDDYDLNVIMIGMLPPLKKSPIKWDFQTPFENQLDQIISEQTVHHIQQIDSIFKQKLLNSKIQYISKIDAFGLKFPDDIILDDKFTYSDNRHISAHGEKIFGARFINHMGEIGLLNQEKD